MPLEDDALIIVDVQRDFLPGGSLAVPNGDDVVAPLAACAAKFARSGRPVVASRDWHPPNHCSFEAFGGPWPSHCVAGTPGAELDAGLHMPGDASVIDKGTSVDRDAYSAFDGTALDTILREQNVQRVYIGGLATEYCVLATAEDALRNGYEVVLLQDAVRAIDPAAGEDAMEGLRQREAKVVQSKELLDA